MSEIRVIARAQAREGKSVELEALLARLVAPTRAEPGCRYYELFRSNLPGVFYFNELWESQTHLDAHAASFHFKEIFAQVQPLLAVALEVAVLDLVG